MKLKNPFKHIRLLSKNTIKNKRVLIRVDFNVTLTQKKTIAEDIRIVKTLPTITLLLKNKNKVIIVSHLNRPKGRNPKLSLKPVAEFLGKTFPKYHVAFIDDFLSEKGKQGRKDFETKPFYFGEDTW